jgi:hypothetical protein
VNPHGVGTQGYEESFLSVENPSYGPTWSRSCNIQKYFIVFYIVCSKGGLNFGNIF